MVIPPFYIGLTLARPREPQLSFDQPHLTLLSSFLTGFTFFDDPKTKL
jgi:hypothetical protein